MSRSLRVATKHIDEVRLALKRKGFPSQQALADAMGMSRATINHFLNGKSVDYANFVEICEKLGLDWQAIAYLEDGDTPRATEQPYYLLASRSEPEAVSTSTGSDGTMARTEEEFIEAARNWDLERLYADLEVAKREWGVNKRWGLTTVEKQYLQGLLCGYSPDEIAEKLDKDVRLVRVQLSNNLYRYVEKLLDRPPNSLENWRDIVIWLAEAGYRLDAQLDLLQDKKTNNSSIKLDRNSLRQLPYQNLPPQTNEFIGRESELAQLLKFISLNHRAPIITVDGIGGVGKTALVLEAAYRCLEAKHSKSSSEAPVFDSIIFTSAKENYLLPSGIVPRLQRQSTLRDIFRAIAFTLDDQTITKATTPEDQLNRVYESLSKQHTLLIVDNFETVENKDEVIGFLFDLPASTKAVITTRERVTIYASIRLDCLPQEDSLRLIQQQTAEKGVTLSHEQSMQVYERFRGVPIALIYAIGQLACGYSLKILLDPSIPLCDDIARFCFEGSVKPLRGQPTHKLLMSLAIFQDACTWEAVAEVSGLQTDPITINRGLAQLRQLSLVRENEGRYEMLSLTHEYALAELAAYPEFEKEARERWVNYYLKFVEKYGGEDWDEWRIRYDHLQEEWRNFLAVLEWCSAQERYIDVINLWKIVNDFANIYCYWEYCLYWLDWLIQASELRNDLSTLVYALSEKGWIMILMESELNLKEAEKILQKAWELRKYIDTITQSNLAHNLAVLRIRQQLYEEANSWLDIQEDLVNKAEIENQKLIRHQVDVLYYRAEISYLQGNYDKAKILYTQVVEKAERISWQRAVNYAQNWLADIAIVGGEFEEAERLLKCTLIVAERNKDKRRISLCQRSYVNLEKARADDERVREWATMAMNGFNGLGMMRYAEEMRSLLDSLG